MLFLNKGVFAGDTILSEGWVDFMKTPAPFSNENYAGTFWLKESNPLQALKDVPGDVFFADGFSWAADLHYSVKKAGSGTHGLQYDQFQHE